MPPNRPSTQSLVDRLFRLLSAQIAEMESQHGLARPAPPGARPRSTAARRRRRKAGRAA